VNKLYLVLTIQLPTYYNKRH